ncbi:MAG: proline--tRNA ligase, partial [Candidatus Portnoybacteria bacterium]|nr:proline--tRNA ligase [Candidatus Portnoybacteria bacterium]
MKQSQLFGKTTKSIPLDIKNTSNKYLYQGGFIRQIAAGRYAYLPLGFRVFNKVLNIVQEEMERIGSQRVITPTLQPIEFWKATNRDKAFGDLMMVVDDHHGSTFAIGGTAEAQMTELIKKMNPTYKDLPIIIHQISNKFRDEKRPRGGLIRLREFTMKDAYSFCKSEKEQLEVYDKFYKAYENICKKLDLKAIVVEADSGALGGKLCHEFMVLADFGEDKIFVCDKCKYAANAEKIEFVRDDVNSTDKILPLQDVHQPANINTIEEMSNFFKVPKNRIIKDVLYKGSNDEYYIVIIRGDLGVNEVKLARELEIDSVKPATDEDLKKLGTIHGSVPVKGLKNVHFIGDLSLKTVKNFTGGYKREKEELEWQNSNLDRDFKVEKLTDVAEAKDGDVCGKCNKGRLNEKRAIEFGHIFNQELFYTKPHNANFTDKDGKEKVIWMGAYGIGIDRALATIIETHFDDKGIVWPKETAPFDIHLIAIEDNK